MPDQRLGILLSFTASTEELLLVSSQVPAH